MARDMGVDVELVEEEVGAEGEAKWEGGGPSRRSQPCWQHPMRQDLLDSALPDGLRRALTNSGLLAIVPAIDDSPGSHQEEFLETLQQFFRSRVLAAESRSRKGGGERGTQGRWQCTGRRAQRRRAQGRRGGGAAQQWPHVLR